MGSMDALADPTVTTMAVLGVVAGLFLLARGLAGYRSLVLVSGISTSRIASLAAGEVRVSGIIEPAEMTLVSLLQSVPCVYYRSSIGPKGDSRTGDRGYTEERSTGFRIRDASGAMRIFPRDARFDAPVRFSAETGFTGSEPSGLDIRDEGATRVTDVGRETAIATLLQVRHDVRPDAAVSALGRDERHAYRESRLEPGDAVTVIGRALPFSDLADPAGADSGVGSGSAMDDPEIAADIAAARAAGLMTDDPRVAWGNAAIPGFGIGRPTTAPLLDPAATPPALASPSEAARTERTFEIAPDALVLASSPDAPLLIAHGVPGDVVGRGQTRFVVGLLGAVLAIASAMVVAIGIGSRMAA